MVTIIGASGVGEESYHLSKISINLGLIVVMTWQAISAQESILDCVTRDVCTVNEVKFKSLYERM